jgi:hypothetical protein
MQGLIVGQRRNFTGFCTKAIFLRGQSAAELELRLGYGAGRLTDGYWLLFATEIPRPDQFEFAGYTHFSGGRPQGHLSDGAPTAEQSLASGGLLLDHKRRVIRDVFKTSGPERIAKVIPRRVGTDYPQGSGVPQWKLIGQGIAFIVAARIEPGACYRGNYG